MPRPSKFAHIVYSTRRFQQMIDGYQTAFEAQVVHQNPMLAFMAYDDEHHRFTFVNLSVLNHDGAPETRSKDRVNHVAYTYASVGDLLAVYERLKNIRVTPYWRIHHGFTLSFYYCDPDDNRLEFQVDACSVEQANAYMRSDNFAANPIGVEVDPENLLAQHRAGVAEQQLLTMPVGPISPIPVDHGL